ncbi:MAG: O-antigen ligase family protein [Nitrospira sp.]
MTYYRNGLAILAVMVFSTGWPYFQAEIFPSFGQPKHWIIAFFVLSLVLSVPTLMRQQDVLKVPLAVWCFGFAWVTILWFLESSQSEKAWEVVRERLASIMLMLSCLMIFSSPSAIRLARWALVFTVLFGVAFYIYDFFVPSPFTVIPGRGAGLHLNPNTSGEALVLGMILSVTVLPPLWRGPFLLLAGAGIFVTFSRSDIMAWVMAVSGLLFVVKGVQIRNLVWTALLSLFVVGLVLLPKLDAILATMDQTGVITKDTEVRFAWLTSPLEVTDSSGLSRAYVAKQAWEKFADHPWVGHGTGSMYESFDIAPHNQYLSYMVDHGVLGTIAVPSLVLALIWRARGETRYLGLVFGVIILFLGFFTHNLLDFGHTLLLFALLAAMASATPWRVQVAANITAASFSKALVRT